MARTVLILPDDLATRLMTAMTDRDIHQATLDAVIGAGADITNETAVTYLSGLTERVTTSALQYDGCMREVLALAREKAGYDASKCSPIQVANVGESGAVSWTQTPERTAAAT